MSGSDQWHLQIIRLLGLAGMLVLGSAFVAQGAWGSGSPMPVRSASTAVEEPVVADAVTTRATRSVALIRSAGRNGSGWVVGKDTVVTNKHVAVARTGDIYVDYFDGERIECYTAVASSDMDLAVLRCETGDRRPLPLHGELPSPATPIAVIGYPQSVGPITTHGVVTGERAEVRGTPTVGFTAPIAPGSSGSPVIDPEGRVIAVATFAGGLGVPSAELFPLLEAAGRFPATKAGAEWQIRIRRASLVALPVLAVGLIGARRLGREKPLRTAFRWMVGGMLIALALTQVQFMMHGPAKLM